MLDWKVAINYARNDLKSMLAAVYIYRFQTVKSASIKLIVFAYFTLRTVTQLLCNLVTY